MKKTIFALTALAMVSGLAACSPSGSGGSSAEATTSPDMTLPTEQPAAKSKEPPAASVSTNITLEQYSKLHSGMSYAKVITVLGRPGTELSSSDLVGHHTAMYAWTNDDGSNMNAMFQDNRMISKAQLGLK